MVQSPAEDAGSTPFFLWIILTQGLDFPLTFSAVHIDDVAKSHVIALDESKVKGGERFLVTGTQHDWAYGLEYAKKKWPERTWASKVTEGAVPKVDTSKAQTVLGLKFKTFETN